MTEPPCVCLSVCPEDEVRPACSHLDQLCDVRPRPTAVSARNAKRDQTSALAATAQCVASQFSVSQQLESRLEQGRSVS